MSLFFSGACHCMFNASGMNCEMCHMGYVGDAIHFKNCTLEGELFACLRWVLLVGCPKIPANSRTSLTLTHKNTFG